MGKVKKAIKPVEAKPLVLNKENKISKAKPNAKKTVKEQIRKSLGVKDPKKTSLKTEQKKLAAVVQNTSSVQITKKSKSLQGGAGAVKTKKSPEGPKRKQKDVAAIVQNSPSVQVTKKSKSLQVGAEESAVETKKSPKGKKRKQKDEAAIVHNTSSVQDTKKSKSVQVGVEKSAVETKKSPKGKKRKQKDVAAIVQNTSSVQVTKKSKSLQVGAGKSAVETKKSPKGKKRKQKDVEDSYEPGKYVKIDRKAVTPQKQKADPIKRLEHRFKIDVTAVNTAFQAVQKLLEEEAKKHNKLFDDDKPIFLQLTSVKVPKCPPRVARLPVKHSLFANGGDICFIAVDIPNTELEETKDHYETLFASKGIHNIKTFIPLRQLLAEYGEYELKRRLVELYDVFLVDGRISGRVSRMLGRIFYEKRKLPVPIKFHDERLQRNVKKALLKTPFHIHPKGDTFVVQVCHSGMSEEQKVANFWSVLQGIDKEFPGHWDNVRSLHLKGTSTMAVPVYLNLISKNEVKTPVIKSKRPKAFVPVSDELSTKNNQKVTVYPTGEVETEVLEEKQDFVGTHSDDETDNSSDEEDGGYTGANATKKRGAKNLEKEEEEIAESDEQSDVEYTQEELSYLQLMQSEKKKAPAVKNKKQKKEKPVTKKTIAKHKGNQKKFTKRNRK